MARTKGSKDAVKRAPTANSSVERMRELASARKLPEEQVAIKVLISARDAMHSAVPRKDRTMFATRAILDAVSNKLTKG